MGLERAGMTCEWRVEIDPFCNKVLEKHWPTVRRYGDVRTVGKHNRRESFTEKSVRRPLGGFVKNGG